MIHPPREAAVRLVIRGCLSLKIEIQRSPLVNKIAVIAREPLAHFLLRGVAIYALTSGHGRVGGLLLGEPGALDPPILTFTRAELNHVGDRISGKERWGFKFTLNFLFPAG